MNNRDNYNQLYIDGLEPPTVPESLHRKGRITVDKQLKHPVTPPPPTADETETKINDTITQHRKHTTAANQDCSRCTDQRDMKNTDSYQENGLDYIPDQTLNRKSGSRTDDFKNNMVCQKSFLNDSDHLLYTYNNKETMKNNLRLKELNPDLSEDRINLKLLSENPVHLAADFNGISTAETGLSKNGCTKEYSSSATSVTDSVKSIPRLQITTPSFNDDTSPITDKLGGAIHNSGLLHSALQTNITESSPTECIHQAEEQEYVHEEAMQNKSAEKSSDDENSPEMQVMINSLSPVLLRRNTSKKFAIKTGGGSSESSPEFEKKTPVSNNVSALELSPHNDTCMLDVDQKESHSLFMDPKMSQTWHGATSANWSQIYGPQIREMVKRLNYLPERENLGDTGLAVSREEQNLAEKSKTLPSSKSLLDEMHKKFCADQYSHKSDTEMARALVLLRLKSNTHPKMGRSGVSQTRRNGSSNIKMGTGTSGSSTDAESSPLLPRLPERQRIKTSPGIQFSSEQDKTGRDKLINVKDINGNEAPRKEEAEIEAVEACRWLKETGFPQYAQMYEDGQFPVDIDCVEKDHDFLDKEDIQSLFRRLNTLNKCAIMKIGTPTKKESEDSEEEDQCALSDKWKYQRSSRRWSRKDLNSPLIETVNGDQALKSSSSHDSLLADQNSGSEQGDSPVLYNKMHHTTADDIMLHRKNLTVDANGNATMKFSPKIRRTASERIKSAKSFLKRVESLKGRRRKPKHISDISGPVVADSVDMQAKIKHLNCKDINSSNNQETVSSLKTTDGSRLPMSSDTGATSSRLAFPVNSSNTSTPRNDSLAASSSDRTGDSLVFHSANLTFSDSDTSMVNTSTNGALGFTPVSQQTQNNSSLSENKFLPVDYTPGRFPRTLDESMFATSDSSVRTRSFSYIDESSEQNSNKLRRRGSCDPRHQLHRISIYDNVPVEEDLSVAQQELDIILSELFQNVNGLNRAINGEDAELLHPPTFSALDNSNINIDAETNDFEHALDTHSDTRDNEVASGTLSSPDISDHELPVEDLSHDDSAEHIECQERRDSGVGSSLTRTNSDRRRYRIRWHSFQKSHRPNSTNINLQLCNLSAGQILVLRKLSLLKLTALLEKYSPNRSGWSLTVPRFMKRNKVPDYKDKNVFGVPFTVMIQRTGQALPQCVLHAMRFLRRTASDALGIFRKSGVRSRIQKLRNEIEANPENIDFEELQAYDVADLVKQYFRELPECLLTTKLSDVFISIFIYVPIELRLEAMQAAIVLMVDENRDVLQSLLLFLSDISKHASEHQMTASNLAVCFAPSLFNIGGLRNPNQTPSPRRNRKNPGIPDARELTEQKAAHECLTLMIEECKKLFTIPAGTVSKCRCWHGDPVTLDELNHGTGEGDNQGYTAYIDSCIQGLLKESRDKFRGWVSVSVSSDVDVSYKKVGDGHPLRLWRCTVDVEAPPNEVLNRVLSERQVWDEDLLQWNTIEKLDKQTEVFQFVRNSLAPHPTRDFCVLRSWRSDLPKGACVLISTSIEHPRAELLGGVRAVELASRYLIEPCGTGKSRLTHISRVDIRGHSPDWYKKVYGHLCANFMKRVCASFQQKTGGPETKV